MVLSNGQFRVMLFPVDFAASDSFYRNGLGLPVDHEWDFGADKGVVFWAGGGMVELLARDPGVSYPQPQGFSLLMQVDSTDRWFELARERGLTIIQEPKDFPWGHRIMRLTDPDGIVVSLFNPIQG